MDGLLERAGAWLARAYAAYGLVFLLIPSFVFLNVLVLAAVVRAVWSRGVERRTWPHIPPAVRKWARLIVEIAFGLINPVIYLATIAPATPGLFVPALILPASWMTPLTASAWILLSAFWLLRMFGSAIDEKSPAARAGVRALLIATLACLLLFTFKDASLLLGEEGMTLRSIGLGVRLAPLYLIPAVLLWDYIRATFEAPSADGSRRSGFFILPDRAARGAVALFAGIALVTAGLAAYRRSDAAVRKLVSEHRASIRAAAERYGVDPRLIASIVYVTHRDQLSPFRNSLERVLISAWAMNMRKQVRTGPPDKIEQYGTDENPFLNRALDISVGLAQIKPRTAQTASVLAGGYRLDNMPRPAFYAYRDVEPIGPDWDNAVQPPVAAPIPMPADRRIVAHALLDPDVNLATCALILALYQRQWETANPQWSLRARPDVLATLYQIGFARSKPHGAPRSNAFGNRVREVYEQQWLAELLAGTTGTTGTRNEALPDHLQEVGGRQLVPRTRSYLSYLSYRSYRT